MTNALSRHLNVTVWRDGKQYDIGFADGFVSEPLTEQPSSRGKKYTGTRVQCLPDPKYFDSPTIPEQQLIGLLQSKAVLLPRCTVRYINEKTGQELSWRYDGGLREYLLAEFTEPLLLILSKRRGGLKKTTRRLPWTRVPIGLCAGVKPAHPCARAT